MVTNWSSTPASTSLKPSPNRRLCRSSTRCWPCKQNTTAWCAASGGCGSWDVKLWLFQGCPLLCESASMTSVQKKSSFLVYYLSFSKISPPVWLQRIFQTYFCLSTSHSRLNLYKIPRIPWLKARSPLLSLSFLDCSMKRNYFLFSSLRLCFRSGGRDKNAASLFIARRWWCQRLSHCLISLQTHASATQSGRSIDDFNTALRFFITHCHFWF